MPVGVAAGGGLARLDSEHFSSGSGLRITANPVSLGGREVLRRSQGSQSGPMGMDAHQCTGGGMREGSCPFCMLA